MDYFEEETGLSKWCWFCCVFVGPCRAAVSVRRIAEVADLSSAIDERRINLGGGMLGSAERWGCGSWIRAFGMLHEDI